mmetsp:Transcript_5230/g.8620  ORF Transcript_5230/g.8620 Transcript_5230/m.8620 type:complete len:600 (-) Transcript_5230:154-1953(-)
MNSNSENVIPQNVRPSSAPMKTPSKISKIAATPTSLSRPTTATKSSRGAGTPVSSREAAILAKAQHTAEKQKRTSLLKEKWAKEKQEKKEMIAKKREEDIKTRQSLSSLASKHRQASIAKNNEFKKAKKEQQRNLLKSSITDNIEAKKAIAKAEKQRRRQSIMVNKEILQRAKKNQAKLQAKKKEEEDSLHVSRRIDFLAVREGKLEEDERRRKSLEAQNAYNHMQGELEKELEAVKKENMSDILAVRKEMHEDDNKAKEIMKQSRRQSLLGRLDTWRAQRQVESAQQQQQQEELQLDIIQRHEDWLDIQEAKKDYKERARQSVLWRLDKWRETKDIEMQEAITKQLAEDTARELFLQEYEDVMQYKQEQEDLRRQSLAYRLDHASREKEWERGEQYVQQAEMENEYKIKAEDRADIARYKKQLDEDRRASLAFRLEEQLKDKEFYAGQTANEKMILAKDNELKLEDLRAVNEYKETLRQEERDNIASRIAESQKQKEKALLEHRKMLDTMHADFESKSRDRDDVNAYKSKEKERSRQSICLRLESWRQGRLAEERQKAKEQLIAADDAEKRSLDYLDMRNAAAQNALDEKARNIKCFL